MRKEAIKELEDITTYTHDLYYFLNYMSNEEWFDCIADIHKRIKTLRKSCITNMDTPLIALKNYTEGRCSWERAGSLCDLHIWGLRKYCEDREVNYNNLRIDEYYGVEGEEGIQKIKEEWNKLDPEHKFEPISYNGKSLYTKYPSLKDKTISEKEHDDAHENYIKYKAKMLISEYACELYKTLNMITQRNPELEEEVIFYKTRYLGKVLSQYSNGINITTQDDLDFLEFTLDVCHIFLNRAKKENDLEQILNSFENLKKILIDEYYHYSINQNKKPTKESMKTVIDMIMNIPKTTE